MARRLSKMLLLITIVLSSCLPLIQGTRECVCSRNGNIHIKSQPDETSKNVRHFREQQCFEYIEDQGTSKYLKVKVQNQIGFILNSSDILITNCKEDAHHNENKVDLRRHKRCFIFPLCDDCMCKKKGCTIICLPCLMFSSSLCNKSTTPAPTAG